MAQLYTDVRVQGDCDLAETASVGDRSILIDTALDAQVRIQRDNYIQSSQIGSYSYTGQSTRIFAARIGRFCSISWHVSIGPSEHKTDTLTTHPLNHDASWKIFPADDLPVTKFGQTTQIGHDVWIGCGAFLKKGITVADGCVIGANAVLIHDTEPYGIYAGSPARLIRHRFPAPIIRQLQALDLYARDDATVIAILTQIRGRALTPEILSQIAATLNG